MTAPPRIYAEWVTLLERFGSGDDSVLPSMALGSIERTSVVAERWTQQISVAFQGRLRALSAMLQVALDRARDHAGIGSAMLLARRGLEPLQAFVRIAAIPNETSGYLLAELTGWAQGTQDTLEGHAERVHHEDYGQLLKTLRDHPLAAGLKEHGDAVPATAAAVSEANPPSRRRIILS